jgi:hypothetical protein
MRTTVVAIAAVLAWAAPAAAHQTAVKYADVAVAGADVTLELRFQPADVTRPLGLPDDAQPGVEQALVHAHEVIPYVAAWIVVRAGDGDGAACAPAGTPALARYERDGRFLALRATVRCAEPVERLVLDLAAFFAVDKKHELLVHVRSPDAAPYAGTIGAGDSPFALVLGEEPPSTALDWIWQGMIHIYGGFDHVLFVIALLIVVVIQRRPDGAWEVRRFATALRATALVVTSFTIAHSLTLIAASLGWMSLPGRFVESMIAVSIVYTAFEDVIRPDVRWRYLLTFGFGLVHGLGFASVLAVLLPPDEVVVPLLEFNVGVELGQLSIVAVALPVLWLSARTLGAAGYRRDLLPILAAPIAGFGAVWIAERVLDIPLL